jgi:hypothetical protein
LSSRRTLEGWEETVSLKVADRERERGNEREGEGKLARGVDLAEEDVGETVTELVTAEESLDEGRSVLDPGELDGSTGLVDDDGVGVDLEDSSDELVGLSGELGVLAVEALRLPIGVGADDDDGKVGLGGEFNGLLASGLRRDGGEGADAIRGLDEERASDTQVRREVVSSLEAVRPPRFKEDLGSSLSGTGIVKELARFVALNVLDEPLPVEEEGGDANRTQSESPAARDVRSEVGDELGGTKGVRLAFDTEERRSTGDAREEGEKE